LLLLTGLMLAGLAAGLAVQTVSNARAQRRQALAQIDDYGFRAGKMSRRSRTARELVDPLAALVGARLEQRLSEDRQRQVRRLLNGAGYYRTSVSGYMGYRALAMAALAVLPILFGIAGGSLSLRTIVLSGLLGGSGWLVPRMTLQRRAERRLELVDREVPELVDLLVTTVEAGVGFAAALQLAGRTIQGPLGEELRLALQEQTMGITTSDALRNMAARIDSTAIRAFIQALLQGEALGVSIAKVLRDLAVDMRKRRRRAAEERAQKAPTKILFPLITLILPATFIVTLGAFVVSVLHSLKTL
jgi:tight adherence protein C